MNKSYSTGRHCLITATAKGPRKALVKTGGEKPAKSVENQINAPIPVGLPVPLLGRTQDSEA